MAVKNNMVVDVCAHAREHNVYFLCSTRSGKKGVVNNSTLGANEVAQMIIVDAVLSAIQEGIGWSLKATDVTEQLAQLSPNYVSQFMGGLVSLGLLDVTKDGNANVYRPNMEFEIPSEPMYIQLGSLNSYGVANSKIKTGPSVVSSGNVFVVSPRDPFSRMDHPAATGLTNVFDGYWLIAYSFSDFITGKPVFVFASYDKASDSVRLRETWLAINNVDPAKVKDAINIHHANFWRVYTSQELRNLGVVADHNVVKTTILGTESKPVGVVVKDVVAPTSGSKVVDNAGTTTINPIATAPAPVYKDTGVADDYVPRKPADFVKPSIPPSFEKERIVTMPSKPKAEIKVVPPRGQQQVVKPVVKPVPNRETVISPGGPAKEDPVINAKRTHQKSELLTILEEVISSALTPKTKDAVVHAIVMAKAYNINKADSNKSSYPIE